MLVFGSYKTVKHKIVRNNLSVLHICIENTTIQALAEEEKQEILYPAEKEIIKQIRQLGNGRATGEDRVGAKLLKFSEKQLYTELHHFIQHTWIQNKIPED